MQKIEEKHIMKEERTMPPLQITRERLLQEGLQKGRQEGRQEERIEILSKLLKANIDIQTICKATGLSKQEILDLQKT